MSKPSCFCHNYQAIAGHMYSINHICIPGGFLVAAFCLHLQPRLSASLPPATPLFNTILSLRGQLTLHGGPFSCQCHIIQLRLGTDDHPALACKVEVGRCDPHKDFAQQLARRVPDLHPVTNTAINVALGVTVDSVLEEMLVQRQYRDSLNIRNNMVVLAQVWRSTYWYSWCYSREELAVCKGSVVEDGVLVAIGGKSAHSGAGKGETGRRWASSLHRCWRCHVVPEIRVLGSGICDICIGSIGRECDAY